MITLKKKEQIVNILREANLCKTSPVHRDLVPKLGTLEDSDESVIVDL